MQRIRPDTLGVKRTKMQWIEPDPHQNAMDPTRSAPTKIQWIQPDPHQPKCNGSNQIRTEMDPTRSAPNLAELLPAKLNLYLGALTTH